MSKEIKIEINIEGTSLYSFSRILIHQQFNAHHTFELAIDHDALEVTGAHTLQKSQDYIGKFITICFGQKDAGENIFKGVITEIGLEQSQGLWGNLILKGHSPTYLMDAGTHYFSFHKRKLTDMLKEASSTLASNDMDIQNKPLFTAEIPYMCQYNESNFDFINRLATEYGEWFYFDGQSLYFGKPSEQDQVDVVYGEHIESMNFSMRLAPSNINHFSYNSKDDQLFNSKLPTSVNGADAYTQKVLDVAGKLYKNTMTQPAPIRTTTKVELDEYAKTHKAKIAAKTVLLTGTGDEPKLKLGMIMNLKVSQKGLGTGSNEHGSYTITSISHSISGVGEYSNNFEAIPAGNEVMPAHVEKPIAEPQIGYVTDDNDPDGHGRVRVQMLWQKEKGQQTDWIRVMSPDAGKSDKVGTNRGYVFIPEIGDQIIVGFRYGDANRPFVMGSVFSGKTGAGGGDKNKAKTIITRSGNTIAFDDDKGSISITDAKGNSVALDGAGNISASASASISLTSGSSSITLSKDGKISISGKEITVSGSESITNSSKSVSLVGNKEVAINSPQKISLDSQNEVSITGMAKATVSSTGTTGIEGTIIKLN